LTQSSNRSDKQKLAKDETEKATEKAKEYEQQVVKVGGAWVNVATASRTIVARSDS